MQDTTRRETQKKSIGLMIIPGGGSVLLNTADVDSIEVYYRPIAK